MQTNNPDLKLSSNQSVQGKVAWQSPSNLAIIKYWGKYGRQLPKNASISLTLDHAHSDTSVAYTTKEVASDEVVVRFWFHDERKVDFEARIVKFFTSVQDIFPFVTHLEFDIRSTNSFPHSSGIASSASGMSALALCLCSIEKEIFGTLSDSQEYLRKASIVSRLGSGSACRSVYSHMASWGVHPDLAGSSNEWATPYNETLHDVYKSFHDDILIVSATEKSVSSTAGHALMNGNPFAEARYQQAADRMSLLLPALDNGDLEVFGKIAEDEALTLHALMMCSDPSYMLIEPATISIINEIRNYRAETKVPVYFSLDAGPNIHMLYPEAYQAQVDEFRKAQLMQYTTGQCIVDKVGTGSKPL